MTPPSRIIDQEQASVLRDEGWKACDMHMHSFASFDVLDEALGPERMYSLSKEAGMDFVVFTDHDTMDAYGSWADGLDDVIRGVELSVSDPRYVRHTFHVPVYGLDAAQFSGLYEDPSVHPSRRRVRDIDHVWKLAGSAGVHLSIAHPGLLEDDDLARAASSPLYRRRWVRDVHRLVDDFPAVEINSSQPEFLIRWSDRLSAASGKPVTAGTDTHVGRPGGTYVLAPGDSKEEFLENVFSGRAHVANTLDLSSAYGDHIIEYTDRIAACIERNALLDDLRSARLDGVLDSVAGLYAHENPVLDGTRGIAASVMRGIVGLGIAHAYQLRKWRSLRPHVHSSE